MKLRNLCGGSKGSVLAIVLALLVMSSLIALSMFSISDDESKIAVNGSESSKAFYAAESGLAVARTKLWADYVNWNSASPLKAAGEIGNRNSYQAFLDFIGLTDATEINMVNSLTLDNGQRVDSVIVYREDVIGATSLRLASYGSARDNSRQVIRSVLSVEGEVFPGFQFALLANNVNCIMCHATFDNVERRYNTDPSLKGTFDRIKVASLESMKIRPTEAASKIAGTLYTRGIVTDKSGAVISNLGTLDGYAINSSTGKIQEPITALDLTNTTGSPLPQNGNLYLNYPKNQSGMIDGPLPTDFPPPFPDDNGNRILDNNEYAQVASQANGTISGGMIYGVASGSTYSGNTLPSAGNESSVNLTYTGNLILVGTPSKPIEINGNIVVNGDVIIQGTIKGSGQIIARGNTYVTGDLTYADGAVSGNRTFGMASDGTRNAFSLAAGNNVMVGDYLTTKNGSISNPTSIDPGNLINGETFSFTMSEVTLFNQREWTKTQALLPNSTGKLVANSTYDPTYVPRYYTLNEGGPVYIFNKKSTYWDTGTNSWQGSEHVSSYDLTELTKLDASDPKLAGASIVALSSKNNWISPQTLKKLWIDDESKRKIGSEFQIDGQIYTSNSIFALTRTGSKTNGMMTVNGSLVASDVGVLVPGGLQIYYDQRLKEFLKLKDDNKVVILQRAWYAEK